MKLADLLAEDQVKLRGTGSHRMAHCPLHKDRTPSLSVDLDADVFCCHSCGVKGGLKDYLMEFRGLPEFEAASMFREQRGRAAPARREATPPKPPTIYRTLPSNRVAVHPYVDAEGTTMWVVVRNAKGATTRRGDPLPKCSRWTPVRAGKSPTWTEHAKWIPDADGWIAKGPRKGAKNQPLYRLPKVLEADAKKQIWVVEGEKCVELFEGAFPPAVVTTWQGGSKQPLELTDWSPLHGRRVLLISDEDETGRAVMTTLAKLLTPHCPEIRMVMPEGETSDDVEQWLDQGGQGRVIEMLKTAKPAPAPDPDPDPEKKKKKKPAEPPPPLRTDEIDWNRHFQVLGNVNDAVAIMLSSYRVFLLSRTSLTQPSTLISLADYHWWLSVTGRDALSGPTAQQIGSVLLRSADRHGQLNPSKFLGRGCFKYDGAKVAWHLGDRLLVEGKTVGLGALPGVVPIGGPPIEVADEPATVAQRRAVADAVLAYRFESEFDGRRFLAWIVAAAIGGALGWRPHAWMSAPAGVGKSWLLDTVLTPLLGDGDLLLRTDDPTAAGLARAAQSDAIAVAFDEAESNRQQVDGVLDLARVASGGSGSRIRADMGSGGYNVLRPRFSLLMSSITVARLTQANATRFVTIRLSPQDVADWPAVKRGIETALQAAPGLRAAIVRDAAQIVASAEQFNQSLIEGGTPSRRASIEAALGAAWEWWSGQVDGVLEDDEPADGGVATDASDAADLLRYILGLRIRVDRDDKSIGRVLRENDTDQQARDYGLRKYKDALWIAPQHPSLLSMVGRGRQWSNVDIQQTLLQLSGVERAPHAISFGGLKARAVIVPPAVCSAAGLNIFDDEDSGDLPLDDGAS